MKDSTDKPEHFDIRAAKNSIRLVCWIFVWAATMVLADKAEAYQWYSSDFMSMAAIVINTAIGVCMILAYMRFLKKSDELQRKIQMDALALSMGVGLVGSFTYSLLVTAKFVIDNEISDIILLTSATFMISFIVGQARYR